MKDDAPAFMGRPVAELTREEAIGALGVVLERLKETSDALQRMVDAGVAVNENRRERRSRAANVR